MPVSKCELEVKKELERTEERIAEIDRDVSSLQVKRSTLSFHQFNLCNILENSRPTSRKEQQDEA